MNIKDNSVKPSWDANEMTMQVIKPDSVAFENLTKVAAVRGAQHQPATLLYDSLALRYNQASVGDLLMVMLPNRPTASNMRKNINNRGLAEGDYRLFRPIRNEHGQRYPKNMQPFGLLRLTNKTMRTVQPFQVDAAKMAQEAEQRGASRNLLQDENPVIPRLAEEISAENQDRVNT